MVKKVGYCLYAHYSNIEELIRELKDPEKVEWLLYILESNQSKFNITIIKYNKKTNAVSLIESKDWDIVHEPTVGDSRCFKTDGSIRLIRGGTKVYHNKWQFVSENYKGFDIEESKRRTELWNSIEGINKHKNRIGNRDYWVRLLESNNIKA